MQTTWNLAIVKMTVYYLKAGRYVRNIQVISGNSKLSHLTWPHKVLSTKHLKSCLKTPLVSK